MPAAPAHVDVQDAARAVLDTAEPAAKCAEAFEVAGLWAAGALRIPPTGAPSRAPDRPARPEKPELVPPGRVARRRISSATGRIALLHAVAHIEFNAIDLAFDLLARFGGDPAIADDARSAFIGDWIRVGADEARHFLLIVERLTDLGAIYGDLSAHDGLWMAAQDTEDDLAARLALAPLVLEARGLDVTPGMIEKLKSAGDKKSAAALGVIYHDEISHVAAGARWFHHVCDSRAEDAESLFQTLVRERFRGVLKPPFNRQARDEAGLPSTFYTPLAGAKPATNTGKH